MLFEGPYLRADGGFGNNYDLAPDGQRFLMTKAGGQTDEDASPPQIAVVLNWTQELLERVPID